MTAPSSAPTATPRLSAAEAVAEARRLAQRIAPRARNAEHLRRLPDETLEDLIHSGLFGIAVPRRWGGSELMPDVWVEVIAELAAACGSTGWVYGVLLGHMWLVSQFPEQAQSEVFGQEGSRSTHLVASLIRLGGTPHRVPGGYRWEAASGRFCSGIDHAQWVVAGGTLQTEAGLAEGRWFLIPREDFEIEDDWFTSGLKGTGSKSIRVPDAFIPEHRSVSMQAVDSGHAPGRTVNPGPLYGLPGSTWTFVLPATPIGIARGAVAATQARLSARLADLSPEQVADYSATLDRFARLSTEVDVAYMLLKRQAQRLIDTPEHPLSALERTLHRRDISYAVQQARHAVNELFEMAGGSGIYDAQSLQRMWRDANAASAHFGLQWEPAAIAYARSVLGLPPARTDRRAR